MLVFIELTGLEDKQKGGDGNGKMRAGERHIQAAERGHRELRLEAPVSGALILTLPLNRLG